MAAGGSDQDAYSRSEEKGRTYAGGRAPGRWVMVLDDDYRRPLDFTALPPQTSGLNASLQSTLFCTLFLTYLLRDWVGVLVKYSASCDTNSQKQ